MNDQLDLEGILMIDKPSGITSHDVVDRVRRTVHMKRIGHAGTLDPMATGLLIILVGKATKLSQYLMSLGKDYEGEITLGVSTNTYDADGEVVEEKPVPSVDLGSVQRKFDEFLGDQYQIPPMFSAIKMKGQPLYKIARKGKEVAREPRFIRISKFAVTEFESPRIRFELSCSKGTYVRSLAHDLGEKFSCGAHLSALRRTGSDQFKAEDSVPLDEFQKMSWAEISKILIPAHQALPNNVL